MKKACWLLVVLAGLAARADNVTSKRVVDVGTTKAVVFEETVAPEDGAYAVGWTILSRSAKAKPVDWSKWDADDPQKVEDFIGAYVSDPDSVATTQGDYKFINCLIDFKHKTYLELPTDDPDFPHKNRGYVVAVWSPAGHGTRYALVQSDARFSTENLWLVTIDATGLHQTDLIDELNKAVAPIIKVKRPARDKTYLTSYMLMDDDTPQGVAINEGFAVIPFTSDIAKSDLEDSAIEGKITVSLADGKVFNVMSDTVADDPFKDDPALAKADGALNAVYAKLAKSLSAPDRAVLKKEQLDWLEQRDHDAALALRAAIDDNIPKPLGERNRSLLESTQKRLAKLQGRLP